MLRLLRLLGLLAPVALILRWVVVPSLAETATGTEAEVLDAVTPLLGALTGAGVMAIFAALAVGTWSSHLSRAVDRLAAGDYGTRVPVPGGGAERRIAHSLNLIAEQLSEKHSAATIDRLTQVANRQTILTELFDEVERTTRYGRPLSVAFVDIDLFKTVNDTYGHHVGDIVLREVAEILRDNIRATDRVGRYGGEEFMLILTETEVEAAASLAEKLRMLVMRQRIEIEGEQQVGVTISIGIAGGTGQGVRFDTIVRDADAAMYSAKNLGRNQTYVFAEPDDDSRIPRAPISAEGRASAAEIGRAARAAAEQWLHSMVQPLPHHRGHASELIAELATSMARALDLPDTEVDRIRAASLLHDVGKVAVPTEILEKPAPLTTIEWQSVMQHPRFGQLILEQASSLRDAVPIILHHHERFSGHGYPYGLRGQDIPLGARIVAVADAYDAMMHDRPYKSAIGHERAIAELRRHAGTQFDPEVVELFCDLYARGVPGYEFVGTSIRQVEPVDLGVARRRRRGGGAAAS
ncbi:MAG TPA: diguanylate cyclase [Candidatus Dormibacteraeota bacterium]|nr:diguanylate cyclase [Candidatus Dormibacteraeota bacterium]